MPDLLDLDIHASEGFRADDLLARPGAVDERAARAELRRQIGHLERQLSALVSEAFPRLAVDSAVAARAGLPRALGLGELEGIRDDLADRVAEARGALAEQAELESGNRELLDAMLAAPADYKWVRVSRDDLGLPGCGHWHSRPRLGFVGMLMGWWRVRISSGCPLAGRLAAVEREVQGRGEATGSVGGLSARRVDDPRRHSRAGDRLARR